MTVFVIAQLQAIVNGKVQELGSIELPEDGHFQMDVTISPLERKALELYGPAPEGDEDPHASQEVPDPGETSRPTVNWELTLDSLLPGTVLSDVDHDDWVKQVDGDWVHKDGPRLRTKSLIALWAPFTIVRLPEVGIPA